MFHAFIDEIQINGGVQVDEWGDVVLEFDEDEVIQEECIRHLTSV